MFLSSAEVRLVNETPHALPYLDINYATVPTISGWYLLTEVWHRFNMQFTCKFPDVYCYVVWLMGSFYVT